VTRRRFLGACGAAAALGSASAGQPRKTKNLILVTADGLRWQDLFTGIDPGLMNRKDAGMMENGAPQLRDRLWKARPEDRRMALLPYFWGALAPLGNARSGLESSPRLFSPIADPVTSCAVAHAASTIATIATVPSTTVPACSDQTSSIVDASTATPQSSKTVWSPRPEGWASRASVSTAASAHHNSVPVPD